ncbi:phosphoenolpyruvate--protein phosphotransferase [Gleimia sp. 6138-11-ORH1]|uniref:phosphoenolpyruvate--protein phosphotransferase n=1 Tax=Gleimia sp. 6138-11-ORH1 TaxID=2973937 RepID=UPI002169E7FC|nr:phosphoenolpyruvate--protein phosphotransferase [Gleimia sp. 6138-11-ORH1]MCS4484807.1 phosphoenolpyruvate--protein phosphotransferase [Gleimia sp. 6138-11-ORH1]
MTAYTGTPVVSGKAYAKVLWASPQIQLGTCTTFLTPNQHETAFEAFRNAAQKVSDRLFERSAESVGTPSDILAMAATLATDPGLEERVKNYIFNENLPATYATDKAAHEFADTLRLAGGYLAERTTDLLDVKNRIIAVLQNKPEPGIPQLNEPTIIFAEDLAPADTAGLNPEMVKGFVTVLGGPTSHTSIIARQMGIPCIVAARDLQQIPQGTWVLINGDSGDIYTDPNPEYATAEVTQDNVLRERARNWQGPAQLADGHKVQLLANVQDGTSAEKAARFPVEGVGLLRSELGFLATSTEPSFETQRDFYTSVFNKFPNHKVVVRTLDAGSDKPIAWASLDDEENPALGVRGIRADGVHPHILPTQVAAVAAAATGRETHTWIMAPMVSTVAEARWFSSLVKPYGLKAGVMIEVPSAALMINEIFAEVDFVSIGTNDLTQYVMAADRLNSHLATYTSHWQPAVLRLIGQITAAGQKAGKPVGVCGEMAADPYLACVLIGLGVDSLSMAAPTVGSVGVQLSEVTLEQCQLAAQAALTIADPDKLREKVREILS